MHGTMNIKCTVVCLPAADRTSTSPGSNPVFRNEKLATNRLICGAARVLRLLIFWQLKSAAREVTVDSF